GGRAPHHWRVLAVVLVVAAANAGGAKALALVQVDGDGVGAPDLEREARAVVANARIELSEQPRSKPFALMAQVDSDVHHVPDGVVARADQIAGEALAWPAIGTVAGQALARGPADPGLLGRLEQ